MSHALMLSRLLHFELFRALTNGRWGGGAGTSVAADSILFGVPRTEFTSFLFFWLLQVPFPRQ